MITINFSFCPKKTLIGCHSITLELTAADITQLTTLKTDLDTKLVADEAARMSANAASNAKATSRQNANVQASFRSKTITANPNISKALKEQLGLTVRDATPSFTPPVSPSGLLVNPQANGINRLAWNRNGHIQNTQFVIECKKGNGAGEAWTFADVTTKTKYDHMNQTGRYRVLSRTCQARRRGKRDFYTCFRRPL